MFLEFTVTDNSRRVRGSGRLALNWEKKIWHVVQDPQGVWSMLSRHSAGVFEPRDNNVMWILDEYRRNPAILYGPPKSPFDLSARRGGGRIYAPTDSTLQDAAIDWTVDYSFTPPPSAPPTAGIREKLIARLRELLPCSLAGKAQEPKDPRRKGVTKWDSISGSLEKFAGTSCGSLPQFVTMFLGAEPLRKGKGSDAKAMEDYMKVRSLSGTNAVRTKGLKYGAWVDAAPGLRPKMGDIYALLGRNDAGDRLTKRDTDGIAHVGVILTAQGTNWTTADLGQGDGFAGKIDVARPYIEDGGLLYGEVKQGGKDHYRVLAGWVDIDRYFPQA